MMILRRVIYIVALLIMVACAPKTMRPTEINDGPLALRLAKFGLEAGDPVFIRIFKEERLLELWMEKEGRYLHFANYPICNYSGELGPKFYEGDKQSPEGFYRVTKEALNPYSSFHKSFNLGFPNQYDRSHKRTGSYLMVHGECVSVGCYAMRNDQIDEIYHLVEAALNSGHSPVEVHAFPFRMSRFRMERAQESPHYDFWQQLERGYTLFDKHHRLPKIEVKEGRYHAQ